MPFPSIDNACPKCLGNLHFEDTIPHPDRRGYDIHTYKCLDCGPMINVTQLADEVTTHLLNIPVAGETNCTT